ncbi:hypothetical protein TD95_001229 [Thielaviopsis punctulata]|uniref:Fatty acid desaturase domain-containing protein n=1 Tax=Thielaviopsis punctulata TaxID=72032 RepID=A0A0F4ZBP3_9PEZI|nr:hypothetical protein TD95_001229 [Thielaviopsis punctulata]
MAVNIFYDAALTKPDRLVLQNLEKDIKEALEAQPSEKDSIETIASSSASSDDETSSTASGACVKENSRGGLLAVNKKKAEAGVSLTRDESLIAHLTALNDSASPLFEPTVFNSIDLPDLRTRLPAWANSWLLTPYIRLATACVRTETDAVMFTHLLLYLCTSVPSAALLFRSFSVWHGALHVAMQVSYVGAYTLLMHQHIHMRGVLHARLAWLDAVFPYITNPLMGHTWNSYYYHHVKHHHVEGNGPHDLSSTLRYQRDDLRHFACYVARFFFLVWADLPLYFVRKGRWILAAKTAFWELGTYAFYAAMFRVNAQATVFVFLLPLLLMRLGLMVGNWGQHAFVDHEEPDSDYRSSITLIDVPSNRHCFNDGYHTSHHLNPLRHWREHPVSFLKGKHVYASQHALVFHNIDYLMITARLMMKDYETLAKCMIPIGEQIAMTLEERMALLKSHTKRFTEEEIAERYGDK